MKYYQAIKNVRSMQGATLAIALIMLLLMTIIGVSAMQTTIFEEKMSSNMRNKDIAFQSAESALREAEAWVINLNALPADIASCASQPCVITYDSTRYLEDQTATWWTNNSAVFSSSTLSNIKSQPRYVIEFYRFVADSPVQGIGIPTGTYYYRVTARATGITDDAVTILQTTVAKRF